MLRDPIAPLKSERVQRALPPGWVRGGARAQRSWTLPDDRLAALWTAFLASSAAEIGARPRIALEGRHVDLALSGDGSGERLLGLLASL
ncbi:MAG: hypothetical protein R2991_11520 [Thermoanaerobaculia bacterium]